MSRLAQDASRALLAAVAAGLAAGATFPAAAQVAVGDRPEWAFETTEGVAVDQDTHAGELVVFDFWATWCGPCVASMPHMKDLHDAFAGSGVNFYGISVDEDRDAFDNFIKNNALPWAMTYQDGWNDLAKVFGVSGIPAVFVFGPDGDVVWGGHPTQLTEEVVEGLVEEHIADDGLTPQQRIAAALDAAEDALSRQDAGMFLQELPRIDRPQLAEDPALRGRVREVLAAVPGAFERENFAVAARAKPRAARALVNLRNALRSPVAGEPIEFEWTTLDGETVTAASLRGQVVLIDFWATWCGPCMAAMPHMTELYEQHATGDDAQLVVLGVSLDQTVDPIRALQEEDPTIAWPMIHDDAGIAGAWGVTGIPTVFLLDREGKLAWSGHPMAGLDDALAAALADTPDAEPAAP